jgi:hypothetical protein
LVFEKLEHFAAAGARYKSRPPVMSGPHVMAACWKGI